MSVGGWEWERREASALMRAALESGDFDALVLAWSRLGDALVNQLSSTSASENERRYTPLRNEIHEVHEELGVVHEERKEDAASFEHRLDMLIILAKKAQAEGGRLAARLGIVEAQQTTAAHDLKEHIAGTDG